MTNISAARLREVFSYDPGTGVFTRLISRGNRAKAGAASGSNNASGYITINIDGKNLLAHRCAWLYVYGEWPKMHIDHINGDRKDNRIENLRDVSQVINRQNMRAAKSNSKTGLLGASWGGSNYVAHIRAGGKVIHLGSFASAELAHSVYLKAKRYLHAGCTI